MSKFNVSGDNKTINYAGGEAYTQNPKLQFLSILLTSFVQDQYYRTEKEGLEEIYRLFDAISDKKFLAKAALYARTQFGMRSISHVVAGELAKRVKGEKWLKGFFDQIIYRADDMTEIVSYVGPKDISHALRKGFAKAFLRFDEYKLAKYKGDGKAVNLVDVANLVHPKSTEAINKLMKGTLQTPDTWEVLLTQAGGDTEKKAEVWKKLITEKKIGYFALLRNLRNIIEQAPNVLDEAVALLTDEALIKKSLVLPFRYSTALEQIEQLNGSEARKVIIALNTALDIAVKNVPKFDGDTLVVLDCSGSMEGKPAEIGALFSAVLIKSNNADCILFSDDAKYHSVNPMDSTLTITKGIRFASGGTNFHAIFETANRAYNRIIILSDMQGWIGEYVPTSTYEEYKRRVGANPKIFSFDLQGYGTMQFPEQNIFCIAGFSEKIFDIMKFLETDRNALINEIEKVEL